jgi:hypothetical protein
MKRFRFGIYHLMLLVLTAACVFWAARIVFDRLTWQLLAVTILVVSWATIFFVVFLVLKSKTTKRSGEDSATHS